MATTEAAPASTGPRYAPEDPTLPKPWKGLIDGSTGILYYWNPETNITQYERPCAPPPPLPAGPPPKLAQIPVPSGHQEQAKPVAHVSQHHGLPQQYPQQHVRPQMMQQQQMPQQSRQQFPQQHSQSMASHQQNQHSQMPQQLSHQYAHSQQQQYMGYRPYMQPQGPQNSHQTPQVGPQGQQFPSQQEYNNSLAPKREGDEFHGGKRTGFSQNVEGSPSQNNPFEAKAESQRTNASLSALPQQYNGPQANVQPQFQQPGANLVHQQLGPRPPNHMDPTMLHQNHKSHASPFRSNNTYENNLQSRPGSDSYVNTRMEGPIRGAQPLHPAAMPNNIRIGGGPPPSNADPGHGTYGHAGPAFPRPHFVTTPDVSHLSPVEIYLKQHEISTT
uniref:DEAD-box ATP-dependent RNA helicase 40 n=1 Tax=Noccaea caerulescens TaxID=107243 RepID=A0A1J3D5R2_NOCCA